MATTQDEMISELRRTIGKLQEKLDAALAQKAALAEVLDVIGHSPGNLLTVFETMLDRAMRLCEAAFGELYTFDGRNFKTRAHQGIPAAFAEFRMRTPPADAPGSMIRRLREGASVLHTADLKDDELYQTGEPTRVSLVDLGGARTVLTVALRKDVSLLGFIVIYRQEVRPFSDQQVTLLQAFAAQAVIAMENARLLTETREALEQQTATAEVLEVINASPGNLTPVFDAVLEKAMHLSGAVFGSLTAWDGKHPNVLAMRGFPPALAQYMAGRERIAAVPPVIAQLAETKRPQHLADVMAGEGYRNGHPVSRAVADLGGARTILHVPLRKDEAMLGYISVYRQEVRAFSDKQIALLENFAAQAVIAMENARLINEQREALEQQTATAEVLQVINASPGELKPVFDAMLEKAMRLCEAAFGVLFTYDGENFTEAASRGLPPAYADFRRRAPQIPTQLTAARRLIRDGANVLHIADLKADEAYASGEPIRRALVDLGGARTGLWVALRKDDALLGAIMMYRQEISLFNDRQVALLQNFAAQAVIAMENARLLGELRERTDQIAELNRGLEARVAAQVEELSRVGRLRRFLAPQLAELIVSRGDEKILESHRREIVVVFCDLRRYTAFTETAEPEEVLDFLREYHGALGPLVSQHEGTLDQFSGDGIMVFFNDPVPIPDPAERALKMAMAMREAAGLLIATWRRRGRDLGFGAGIAQGYATLGQIGFSDRSGYTAIGTVCNVAARLCAEAKDGQILLSQRIAAGLDGSFALEELGPLALKGLTQPIVAYNVPAAGGQAALRVIEGRPQNV